MKVYIEDEVYQGGEYFPLLNDPLYTTSLAQPYLILSDKWTEIDPALFQALNLSNEKVLCMDGEERVLIKCNSLNLEQLKENILTLTFFYARLCETSPKDGILMVGDNLYFSLRKAIKLSKTTFLDLLASTITEKSFKRNFLRLDSFSASTLMQADLFMDIEGTLEIKIPNLVERIRSSNITRTLKRVK